MIKSHFKLSRACVLHRFSCVQLFATPWTVTRQAPLSMGFSRQEYWRGLPCPPPEDLLDPGIKPSSLTLSALIGKFFSTSARIGLQVPPTPTYACGPWNQWNRQQRLISALNGQVVTVRKMLAELKKLISKWSSCCHLWPSPTLEGTLPWTPDMNSRQSPVPMASLSFTGGGGNNTWFTSLLILLLLQVK